MSDNDLVESSAYEEIKRAREVRKTGAPKGSQNHHKGKVWLASVKRAIAKGPGDGKFRKGLDKLAAQLVNAAMRGEQWAIQELGNRLDGKPTQPIERDDSQPLAIFEGRVRLIPVLVDAVQQPTVIEHNDVVDVPQLPASPEESKT